MTPSLLNGSDTDWLIYSDWLEEAGQAATADGIREDVAQATAPPWQYEYISVGGVGVGVSDVGVSGVGVGVGSVDVSGVGGVGGVGVGSGSSVGGAVGSGS